MRWLTLPMIIALAGCDVANRCARDADCAAPERCVRFNVGRDQMGSACFALCGDEPRTCPSGATCVACRDAPSSCTLDDGSASGPYCAPP